MPTRSHLCRTIMPLVVFSAVTAFAETKIPDISETTVPQKAIWVDELDIGQVSQDWGTPQKGKSVGGKPLTLAGKSFVHGLGTHAASQFDIVLNGCGRQFMAMVGIDDEKKKQGSVIFRVEVDGKLSTETGIMRGGDEPQFIAADLRKAKTLSLIVDGANDGIDHDHADWGGAIITLADKATTLPRAAVTEHETTMTIASGTASRPSINGPRVVGTTPGRPFLFLIPATGDGPLEFTARNLPKGLEINPSSGIISGSVETSGTYEVELRAIGPKEQCVRMLRIEAGEHKLARTPPMGWNSWNAFGVAVTADKVRQAADALVDSGLAAHGYQYINIDDAWEKARNADGEITTNDKFGDVKALADYVHSKGLKLGIYSSPGPRTCGGYEGSYKHEAQDANTYAKWGVDYLKYDWCSYGDIAKDASLPELQKPYRVMREALDGCGRDIVFSLCQYGMGDVWKWGGKIGGNLWRTTGDISDSWNSMSSIGFSQSENSPYVAPGGWNDPDMLVVGQVGWGPELRPSRLTGNEQITHITLWSMLAAPLLIGCDMTQLDQFTSDLLMNDEVIAVDQDPLGKAATCIKKGGKTEVWSRPLEDGTIAVALFNRGRKADRVTAEWKPLGLSGKQPVRDLWQRKDLKAVEGSFTADVPAHGAVLLKIGKPKGDK